MKQCVGFQLLMKYLMLKLSDEKVLIFWQMEPREICESGNARSSHGWIFFQKILILLSGWFWKILICWRAKMMIFGNICQIVRKRCQMMKQMRKKAHLEEKYLVLGGFCPKNMVKEQFFCALRALKILILLNLAQKAYYSRIFTHAWRSVVLVTWAEQGFTQDQNTRPQVIFQNTLR